MKAVGCPGFWLFLVGLEPGQGAFRGVKRRIFPAKHRNLRKHLIF